MSNSLDSCDKESLQLIIEEQRRDYDYLLHIYDRLRATESILLTAIFGTIAYLYYNAPFGTKTTIAERFFVPAEDYGKVIYIIAAGFFLYGTLRLTLNVFGNNPWMTAYETPKDNYDNNQLNNLKYVKKRYDECSSYNGEAYDKRRKELVSIFYSVLISAIILIVIKTLK